MNKKTATFSILLCYSSVIGGQTLNEAYSAHIRSVEIADSALSKLALNAVPISDSELNNYKTPINDVYNIFQAVWKPDSIDNLGEFESWGISSAYTRAKYVLVQNSINYMIVGDDVIDSISKLSRVRSDGKAIANGRIDDFRPKNTRLNGKTIYLSQPTIDEFASFLMQNTRPKNSNAIKNEPSEFYKLSLRGSYLRELLVLVEGHFGGWILPTFPWVEEVIISESGTVAYAKYSIRYQGGTAKFIKKDGRWEIISSRQTWIQ